MIPNSISGEKTEKWLQSLWDEIKEANANREEKGKAPLIEIDLDKKQIMMDEVSRYLDAGIYQKNPARLQPSKSFHPFWEMMRLMRV